MTGDFEIRPFDRTSSSDEDFRTLWAFTVELSREVLPGEPPMPAEDWIRIARTTNSLSDTLGWVVWDGGGRRILGATSLSIANHDLVNADLHIAVDPSIRRRGFGTKMLGLAADLADSRGRTVLSCQSNDRCPAGAAFLEGAGARRECESHTNSLLLGDVDEKLVKSWLELPRGLPVEFEFRYWRDGIPEENIDDARDFAQEIHDAEPQREGIPKREIRFTTEMVREWNRMLGVAGNRSISLAAVTRADGRLMGYTQVAWHPSKPRVAQQWFTGVRPAYRHHGLARRLKAGMLAMIRSEFPEAESVRSGNDDDNEGIMRINRELGYRPFIARIFWALDVATAREHLRKIAEKTGASGG